MKTYEETLDWMYSKLPMYQKTGKNALKKDLTNITKFLDYIKHPEQKFRAVHVAGTNGKGSVSHMIASVLIEAGYKVGLYTSPHLKDFRERITVNGKPIRKKYVMGFINRYHDFLEENALSFFEMTVAMAFEYFAKHKVDLAVIETGMGGRLDSTNVIMPILTIITNIQKDHTEFLGETLKEIAAEKAGIIKPGIPVIVGEMEPDIMKVIREFAEKSGAEFIMAPGEAGFYETDLKGPYQKRNLPIVIEAINHLRALGFAVSEPLLVSGLMKVKQNTGFRGRWDITSFRPLILFDTAHNPAAIKIVMDEIKKMDVDNKHFVLSFVKGKDVNEMLSYFPQDGRFYISQARIPRALPKEKLAEIMEARGLDYSVYENLNDAFEAAKEKADENDLIFVGGSTFTVAELI